LIDRLKSQDDPTNAEFIEDNKKLIALAMKHNPRELKRFINILLSHIKYSSQCFQ
jgi:hypothetical protein